MVFSSHLFLLYFLPASLLLYALSPRRGRNLVLAAVSFAFYGWSNPLFLALLLLSTLIDWVAGLVIAGVVPFRGGAPPEALPRGAPRSRRQKTALVLSVTSNLSLLGFFKYFNFAADSWNTLAAATGLDAATFDLALRVTLPLGISFYTFQSMSYAIDVYRGDARALRNFLDFACFVSMFPQLVAGPIIRFSEIDDQLRDRTPHPGEIRARRRFLLSRHGQEGAARKSLRPNRRYRLRAAGAPTALEAWHGIVAYAFQIYFDFSGYSDMAIGLGLMLGFVFPRELRLALSLAIDHRVLASLAHLAFHLAARLSLRAAGRQPARAPADLHPPRI